MLSKSIESDFSALNWIAESEKIRYVYSREILVNRATIREVNSTEIDYGERNTGLRAITAPNYKQPNKLSQLQNTQLDLLTVTFLAIFKWTAINLRSLIVDGCVKEGKRLMITVTGEGNLGSGEKIRPVDRIVKSWIGHVRIISQSNLRS